MLLFPSRFHLSEVKEPRSDSQLTPMDESRPPKPSRHPAPSDRLEIVQRQLLDFPSNLPVDPPLTHPETSLRRAKRNASRLVMEFPEMEKRLATTLPTRNLHLCVAVRKTCACDYHSSTYFSQRRTRNIADIGSMIKRKW